MEYLNLNHSKIMVLRHIIQIIKNLFMLYDLHQSYSHQI